LQQPIRPQLDALRPGLRELVALNREVGISGLYQNHSGPDMVGAGLWDIYDLIKDFPPQDLGLAYDIRHAQVEGGLSWPAHFSLVQSHVTAICVKDFVWDNAKVKNVPLGQGRVNAKILQMVKASKFRGPISLHVEYGENTRDRKFFADAFRQDLGTLRRWLDA